MSKVKLFGTIQKVDDQDDGTVIVFGVASSEVKDSQGEIVTAEAMKAAIPGYMAVGGTGAVREMHQPSAAGVALKCYVGDDNLTYIEAHIVKDEAVKLVKHGVYKGFSIGGKVTKRDDLNKNTITGLRLTEVSLVDVPANPEAVFSMVKMDDEEVTLGTLRKGMYGVASFAEVLQRLAWLAQDSQSESEWEGDGSPIPGRLGKWVADGCEILKELVAEEINELISVLPKGPLGMVDVNMAAGTGDLAKKGAKFSKATKEALFNLHKSVKEANDHLDKMGYDKDEEDDEPKDGKKEDDGDAGKADAPAYTAAGDAEGSRLGKDGSLEPEPSLSDDMKNIKKALADTTTKAEALTVELAKAADDNAALSKRIAELEKLPAAPKGVVTAVAKGVTTTPTAQEAEPVRKGDGTVDEAATLIKSIHRGAPVTANQ